MSEIPLGQRESQRLELKSRDALKDRHRIGREVVAMLNAEGGEVWVGLAEEDGRAVQVEPVENAETERRMLQDFLVDSIEPSPSHPEVEVHTEDAGPGRHVLRIEVRPTPERKPYALLKQGGRWYVTRVGDRLRPMGREEICPLRRDDGAAVEEAGEQLLEEQREALQAHENLVWLALQPAERGELRFQSLKEAEYLTRPELSGNRRTGYHAIHFGRFLDVEPRPERKRLVLEMTDRLAVVRQDGGLRYQAPLDSLILGESEDGKRFRFHPRKLLEHPISLLRLAAALIRDSQLWEREPGFPMVAQLALTGLTDWELCAGSPPASSSQGYRWPELDCRPAPERDFLGRLFQFSREELLQAPDRCGFRMIREIYEAFGLYEDAIPEEFDRKTGRLVLPES